MITYVIVQTAFIGDVLLTIPLCTAVKKHHPTTRVVLITTPVAASMLRNNTLGIEVVGFNKKQRIKTVSMHKQIVQQLALQGEVVVLVPHKSLSTAKLVQALHAEKIYTYSDAAIHKFATISIPYPELLHDADRHLELLKIAGMGGIGSKESYTPIQLLSKNLIQQVQHKFQLPEEYVVLAPATVWATKQWPIGYWQTLAEHLSQKGSVVIIGDNTVARTFRTTNQIYDLTGNTNLEEALAIIAPAKVVVANDSAPVHMASLMGVPVVALFGPTIPEYGFSPFSPNSVLMQNTELKCRPCTKHGGKKCPIGTHECLQKLKPNDVEREILGILQHETN